MTGSSHDASESPYKLIIHQKTIVMQGKLWKEIHFSELEGIIKENIEFYKEYIL